MKKPATIAALFASGFALSSGDVHAGATVNTNTCYGLGGASVQPSAQAIVNLNPDPVVVNCPVEIDHQLGSTVTFRVAMEDNNPNDGGDISCTGFVYNQDGVIIASTSAAMVSDPGTFEGAKTATVTVSPQSPTYMYSVQCTLPGAQPAPSGLHPVRVF